MEALLYQTLSTDDNERSKAVQLLEQHETENYLNYAMIMCQVIANNQIQDNVRMSAGLALKNSLTKSRAFGGILADQRSKHVIKSNILPLLATKPRNVANIISQLVATMAIIDLPLGEADDIISTLVYNVTQRHQPSHVKQVALQTIGYICEAMKPELLQTCQKNLILTAIIDGSRREQLDVHVKLAAIKSLYNSLEFIRENFENNLERDFIMKVICDAATPSTDSTMELQVAAYECLNKVVSLYYDKMDDYMTSTLYNLTLNGMTRTANQSIVLQSIEFWSTICEIEITKKKENATPMFSFVDKLMIYSLPTLLKLLIKDKDSVDKLENEDEWDIPKSASNCLSLLASCCKELLVPQMIRFIEKNLLVSNQVDWNQKEAAIIAFGSMLNGPSKSKMKPLVEQILPTILSCMKYPNAHVRLAASWTLGEIIKESPQVLNQGTALSDIISAITFGLRDSNERISHNTCLAIIHCAEKLKSPCNKLIDTGPLSIYSHGIITCLLDISKTFDIKEDDTVMQTIYEAISTIIKYCEKDCDSVVQLVTESVILRLEILYLAETEMSNAIPIKDIIPLQSSLLGVLLSCIYRLSDKISVYSSRIMTLFFSILSLSQKECNKSMSVLVEDIYLLASGMIISTGPLFDCFVNELVPHISELIHPVSNYTLSNQDHRLCSIGVGIISDLCCTLPNSIKPHASLFMQLLLSNLSNDNLHKDVKPVSISCFGDVAHALGPDFLPFVNTLMMILQQAGNMQADQNNMEMTAYVNAIRVSIIEAFVGMLQGLGQDIVSRDAFLPHVNGFMLFVNSLVKDNSRSDLLNQAILGLLGDIARIYENRVQISMLESVLHDLIIENLKGGIYFSARTKEIAQWAQEIIAPTLHKYN